ncbi:hypothetical protein NUW54_g14402 [Trametes sanguinea]|uniref:Uncharacterized protein n=1 Tax=Trametes sanguinea TaxID=158606 RepID=A0ACC1MCF9_9APHY|nr:hypothetical protein NUW54_g14402 [Trametes sanguinea]
MRVAGRRTSQNRPSTAIAALADGRTGEVACNSRERAHHRKARTAGESAEEAERHPDEQGNARIAARLGLAGTAWLSSCDAGELALRRQPERDVSARNATYRAARAGP